MTGSEKQIEWAENIKKDFYSKKSTEKQESFGIVRPSTYTRFVNTACEMVGGNEEETKKKIDAVLESMNDAKQWIDSRHALTCEASESDKMPREKTMSIMHELNKYA